MAGIAGAAHPIGAEAGAADTSLYVLHMDNSFFASSSASAPSIHLEVRGNPGDRFESAMFDERILENGLTRLVGYAGGAFFPVRAGNGAVAFGPITRYDVVGGYLNLDARPAVPGHPLALHPSAQHPKEQS